MFGLVIVLIWATNLIRVWTNNLLKSWAFICYGLINSPQINSTKISLIFPEISKSAQMINFKKLRYANEYLDLEPNFLVCLNKWHGR